MRLYCQRCKVYQTLNFRSLICHYRTVHATEPNFQVTCSINSCVAVFSKVNSLYKHVNKYHKEFYNQTSISSRRKVFVARQPLLNEDQSEISSDATNSVGFDGGNDDQQQHNICLSDSDDSDDHPALQAQEFDMKKNAALFLLKTKERQKISQVGMNSVIENVRSLVYQHTLSFSQQIISKLNACGVNNYKNIIEEISNQYRDPFTDLDTEALQRTYICKNFSYIEPEKVVLGKILVRNFSVKGKSIAEKEEHFMYIPISESLQQLLGNDRIRKLILKKPVFAKDDLLYDICDGTLFQEDHFFQQHKQALALIIYHDELEVCNPLGSNAGTHKLDMFYYTVANLTPKFRSKHCAVKLMAIANASLVKKYGIESILQKIVCDISKLHEGVEILINGKPSVIFGKVLICTGDTPGQNLWGGFKEGVGFAFQKCRDCYCDFDSMQTNFSEDGYILRSKELYDEHCTDIENACTDYMKNDLKCTYGLNKRSLLCQLPGFDITKQMPQDIMHTLLEGIVQYELRLVLDFFIKNNFVTLNQINGSIINHNYGYSEVSTKPSPLRESVFSGEEKYKLKYNAEQAHVFLRLFPFLLSPLVSFDEPCFIFILQLIKIVHMIFSPVLKKETVELLKIEVELHLKQFKELFPDSNILPKHHYLIHIPRQILQLGPMVRSSCFSFEAAHLYFKELARKQNFKNLSFSLAKRHQYLETSNFADSAQNPNSHPLFATERKFGVLREQDEESTFQLRQNFDKFGILPGIQLSGIYKVSWFIGCGTKYCKNGMIALDVHDVSLLPIFGKIVQIWVVMDYIYFELEMYSTLHLNEEYQSYEVIRSGSIFRGYESLLDYNIYHLKSDVDGRQYIPLKYYLGDIIDAHIKGDNPLHY